MTDIASTISGATPAPSIHRDDAAKKRLRARYGSELRFKWTGAAAVALAALFLLILLSTILTKAVPAFRMNYLTVPVNLSTVTQAQIGEANYAGLISEAVAAKFPDVTSRQETRLLRGLVSTGAGPLLRQQLQNDPSQLGKVVNAAVPLDDFADLYLKGLLAANADPRPVAGVTVSAATGEVDLTFADTSLLEYARGAGATAGDDGTLTLTSGAASLFVEAANGTVKLTEVRPDNTAKGIVYEALDAPVATPTDAILRTILTSESSRKIRTAKLFGWTIYSARVP